MGQNFLRHIDFNGRVTVDLMKHLQKSPTINLENYKLDFVTAYFIRESINIGKGNVLKLKFNTTKNRTIINTTNVNNIKSGQYIYLTYIIQGIENIHPIKYKINKIFNDHKIDLNGNKIYSFSVKGIIQHDLLKEHKDLRWKRSAQYKFDKTDIIDKKKTNIKSSIIYTKSIYGIYENQFTRILYNDGLTENVHDEKYRINKIIKEPLIFKVNGKDTKVFQIIVDGYIPESVFENNNEVFWCNAKDDISPNQIFKYQKGSDADRSKICKYCIQDCVVVTKLAEKLKILTDAIGMANVCHVPLSYIFERGQTIKIYSLAAKECRDEDTLIPTLYNNNDDDENDENKGYEGATVLNPDKGVHYEPIVVLDFRSLYPRSMKMGNVSHETYVTDEKYLNLKNYTYYTISFKNNDGTISRCTYAKNKNNELGIIPKILTKLLDKRDEIKGLMKTADNDFLKSVFDGLQLAYKVTANSLYGQVGYEKSYIYLKELAASTTAIGRKMLQYAKKFVETIFVNLINRARHDHGLYIKYCEKIFKNTEDNRFILKKKDTNGEKIIIYSNKMEFYEYLRIEICKLITNKQKVSPKVIYGDSVTADTPILLRKDGQIYIKTIETINNEWKDYNNFKPNEKDLYNKEQNCNTTNYDVWSNNKWTKIKRVIRHKTNKKIYRVNTHKGVVDVTEDHSLMNENLKQIKPKKCNKNTKLLQSYPQCNENLKICDIYAMQNKYHNFKNKVDDLYLLFSFGNTIRENNDNNINNNIDNNIIGNTILNENINHKLIFLSGYINNVYSKNVQYCEMNDNYTLTCKGKVFTSEMYYLTTSIGLHSILSVYNSELDIYKIVISEKNINDTTINNKIQNITFLRNTNNEEYVYDLETEEGIFNAGIGEIIVKNTDSIFFSMKIHDIETKEIMVDKEGLRISIEFGKLAGETICKLLPEFQELAYEKTMWPLILITKKKYVGNLYEEDIFSYYLKCMGIVLKRRDNAKIVKIVVGCIVNYIINERSNQGAINYTKLLVKKILKGEFPIDKFVLSKTLKSTYKNRDSQAHAVLADRIGVRDPGNKPNSNDRIQFVYFIPKKIKKKMLQGDKVEDPKYLIDNKLEIDYLHYITNQVMKPSLQFLNLIADNPEKIFNCYIEKEKLRRKNNLINNYRIQDTQINENNEDNKDEYVYNNPNPKKIRQNKKQTDGITISL